MSHDPGRRRFFAQLNLFIVAMLLLVIGNNFVMLYLGWEGVGLASYLLIGFYQDRPSAATAAKKAFLMNRVGDVGLALAIFLLWTNLGTVQYTEVFARIGQLSPGTVLAVCVLLLLGACGKSGQFPLQSWLPDAMEGPTPVYRADPRGNDGHRRCLPGGPVQPDLRRERRRPADRHHHRHDHAAARRDHRLRLRRHQEGAGLLHGEPDRLHDAGRSASARPATRWVSRTCSPTASSRPGCSSAPVR